MTGDETVTGDMDRPPLTDRVREPTSLDPDHSLTREQAAAEPTLARPLVEDTRGEPAPGYKVHPAARIFVRGPWEMAASIVIAIGVVMLMQPFALWAYTYSFAVTLLGTVMFMVVSHFPERAGAVPDDRTAARRPRRG